MIFIIIGIFIFILTIYNHAYKYNDILYRIIITLSFIFIAIGLFFPTFEYQEPLIIKKEIITPIEEGDNSCYTIYISNNKSFIFRTNKTKSNFKIIKAQNIKVQQIPLKENVDYCIITTIQKPKRDIWLSLSLFDIGKQNTIAIIPKGTIVK